MNVEIKSHRCLLNMFYVLLYHKSILRASPGRTGIGMDRSFHYWNPLAIRSWVQSLKVSENDKWNGKTSFETEQIHDPDSAMLTKAKAKNLLQISRHLHSPNIIVPPNGSIPSSLSDVSWEVERTVERTCRNMHFLPFLRQANKSLETNSRNISQ